MKRQFPTPLHIDCDGLSKKRAIELADQLVDFFDTVEFWCDEIIAHKPRGEYRYELAWRVIDKYSVRWS